MARDNLCYLKLTTLLSLISNVFFGHTDATIIVGCPTFHEKVDCSRQEFILLCLELPC